MRITEEARRVDQVARWILTGARELDVIEAIQTTWPEAEISGLLADAVKSLAASGKLSPSIVRGWCFEAARSLYQKMVEIGDFAGALAAVKQIHAMAKD